MGLNSSKKKSVLLVSNCTWYLYNFREDLIIDLKERGYQLILLSSFDDYYHKISKHFTIKENLFLKRGSENPLLEIITLLNLFLIYLKYKPSLVHHFTIKPCIYGGLISRFIGIKNTINHITGLGPSFYSNRIKINLVNKILYPIYKYAFNNNKNNLVNIFHNNSDRDAFISKGLTSVLNSKVIPGSGVDIKHFQKSISKKNINIKKQILFPARVIREKGIIELLLACEELWNEDYQFILNIAGEIDTQNKSHIKKNNFEYLIRDKSISFLGKSNNMLGIYRNIDIVILPSWREGLSKSLLEAASMSLPIITTDVPGCRELIKNNYSGLIVKPKNKEDLKSALKIYLENPKLAEMYGKKAREMVTEKYTVQIINKLIIEIYNKFMKI